MDVVILHFILFYERKLSPSGEFRQLMKKKILCKDIVLYSFMMWKWCGFLFPEIVLFYMLIIIVYVLQAMKACFIYNAIEHYIL